MKIAYVVSGMKMTFVINEMTAHEQAGWEVLPLASCGPERFENWSEYMIKWCKRAIYRPNIFVQVGVTFREMFTHPIRLLRVCLWLATLLIHSPVEFAKAVYELTAACHFAGHLRRFGAEHIHVHFASRSLSLGLMIGMLTDLPVSCTVHAFDIFTRTAGSLRPRLAKCKFIAAISRFNVEYLRNVCGDSVADLCHVVHCGIDVEKFNIIRNTQACPERSRRDAIRNTLLCVARLEAKKGLDVAIAACAKLREKGAKFLFQIIGDGPEGKRLKEQISQLGLEDCVVLLGPKPNDQLVEFYSRASVFFMPCVKTQNGDMDGIPVAMMEAMACELPVVSTRLSGIDELVHHSVNGLLVDMREEPHVKRGAKYLAPQFTAGFGEFVDTLAEAVKSLLSNPDRIRQFGRAARKQIEKNFNIKKTAAQLRQLIQEQNYEKFSKTPRNRRS
ncbi:MAG: glycosyltransferase [Sedimentisphaerales bacterium]